MSPSGRPEFLQLGAFIAALITPVKFNLNCLDLILLWQWHPGIDVRGHLVRRPAKRNRCVEIPAALLQVLRGPIFINRVWVSPRFCATCVPVIGITARHRRTRRWFGLLRACE